MRLLNRYIREAVVSATVLVVLILLGIEIFMEFVSQLSKIGSAQYGLGQAFLYVLYQLPSYLYQLFPISGFLGCLIGLGRLASSSQLIIMQASGVSVVNIVVSVVKAALFMILIVTFIGEFVAPQLELKGAQMRSLALSQAVGYQKPGGIWLRDSNSFIHIGSIESEHKISNISRFQFYKHRLLSASFAPEGRYLAGTWVLYRVKQSLFTANQIKKVELSQLPLEIVFNPRQLDQDRKTVYEQSIIDLYHTIQYRIKAKLQDSSFVFSFWQRIIQPFATIVMICLGIPFIFGSLRQVSMGFRVFIGAIIGFTFYMLNQFFGPFAVVYQLSPLLSALMPTVLFAIACVILFRYSQL